MISDRGRARLGAGGRLRRLLRLDLSTAAVPLAHARECAVSLPPPCLPRRKVLAALGAAPLAGLTRRARAAAAPRTLSFYHLHTGEELEITYFEQGEYVAAALAQIDRLLRDFRTDEIARIDPALLDILYASAKACGHSRFEIISGYRSPATNASLAETSFGVARNSLHMLGRAVDVRLAGYDTAKLRRVCVALGLGGVGFYPASDFVHLDTGRFRTWGPA